MEMEEVGREEEEEEEQAGHGRRTESDQGDVEGRWEKQECRWREVDKQEQEERGIAVEL